MADAQTKAKTAEWSYNEQSAFYKRRWSSSLSEWISQGYVIIKMGWKAMHGCFQNRIHTECYLYDIHERYSVQVIIVNYALFIELPPGNWLISSNIENKW